MTLALRGVGKRVGTQVHVHPIELRLERGSMNVLLGPTLAGKTTLMRLMAGLDRPTEGRVFHDDRDVTDVPVQHRGVAMVYQQFINYPNLSVFENIASPLKLQRRSRAEIEAAVRRVAEMLRIEDHLDRTPLELSGGQQQRCAMARALIKGADLVLLDEPLANLDYKLREELRSELPRLFAESGAIFVYATTEPEEALLLGGQTATLWEGRVTQFGPAADVWRQPCDATTARVVSDPPMNFADIALRGERLLVADAERARPAHWQGLPDGDYRIGFRADHLRPGEAPASSLRFAARVSVTETTGASTYLHLHCGEQRWVSRLGGTHELAAGSALDVSVDPAHAYLFATDGALVRAAAPRSA